MVNDLGNLCKDQGRPADAEAMRALDGFERTLGSDQKSTLETVNKLGNFHKDQGRLIDPETI